ncbi:alpha/beta hydrolase [Phormidesmis sp. 146-35]
MSLSAIAIPSKSASQGLIVILHGWGANAQDVAYLCSLLELPNCEFRVPDAPFPHPYGIGGKMWYDLSDNLNFRADIATQQDLLTSRQLLTDWLKSLESETGIPLNRTILGGFSQGGAMTLDVGLSLPLAGLMVLSGYLHGAIPPLDTAIPPLLIVHGRQDEIVPLKAAQIARDRLTALGAPLQYQEFDMGHEISPQVLNEMQQFIQKTLN